MAADSSNSSPKKDKAASKNGGAKKGQNEAEKSVFYSIDCSKNSFLMILAIIFCISFATRMYKVTEPEHVCWDETHFGKMANWYLNNTFFFDVHPPLGKMLIALAGHVTGYNGTFAFENPGYEYNGTNYEGMRIFCSSMGAFLGPLASISVWNLTGSLFAAVAAGLMITFDTGMIALTQYILLDSPLLFFISLTSAFCTWGFSVDTQLQSDAENPDLVRKWWIAYAAAGVSLACALGVKFVGLFVVLWAGSFTIFRLWNLLATGNNQLILNQFLRRALTLILLPFIVYSIIFYFHLSTLYKSGAGDGFYSSEFQSTLEGNPLAEASMPEKIAYGSVISLKSSRLGAGYLHSHWHLYAEGFGARQQQITLYGHKDDNNKWLVTKEDEIPDKEIYTNLDKEIEFLTHGSLIRLMHVITSRNLHSHKGVAAPITRQHNQVTGYGENGTGDANDVWRIEVQGGVEGVTPIRTLVDKVRLVHQLSGCTLYAGKKQLPKWAFEQLEVSCNPRSRIRADENVLWQVEDNVFEGNRIPNVSLSQIRPGFFSRLWESHVVMLQGNSNLKPKDNEVTSRPWQWPINLRGQWFSINNKIDFKIYLLGNPVIWWGNLLIMAGYFVLEMAFAVRRKRGYVENELIAEKIQGVYLPACRWLLLAWGLHYIPFFTMGRVLYYHHYFPAHLFACMLSAICLQSLIIIGQQALKEKTWANMILKDDFVFHIFWGVVLAVLLYAFCKFQMLTYGFSGSSNDEGNNSTELKSIHWLSTWEF